MNKDNIVPDVIDVAPSACIHIQYPSGKKVSFGIELTPTDVKDEPSVSWEADKDKYYLLVMTDPDPSAEVREAKHWLVANIKGKDVSTGETLAEYVGSGPPKGTGLHRYIFFIYEQPGKLDFNEQKSEKYSLANRLNFSVRKFAKKYNLGHPIAGNYYKAQWDEYVEEMRKNFKRD